MNSKKYVRVVKESWDALWHAYYETKRGTSFDRVSEKEAVQIARGLK